MKKIIFGILAMMVLATASYAEEAKQQNQSAPLQLTLKINEPLGGGDEMVEVAATLKNNTKTTVQVTDQYQVLIRGPRGVYDDIFSDAQSGSGTPEYTYLEPGEAMDATATIETMRYGMLEAGSYAVEITYTYSEQRENFAGYGWPKTVKARVEVETRGKEELSAAEMFPFSRIMRQGDLVKLQFPDGGSRWTIGVNAFDLEKRKLSGYGEVIKLKTGEQAVISQENQEILLRAVRRGDRFFIEKTVTSGGGSGETSTFVVPVLEYEGV